MICHSPETPQTHCFPSAQMWNCFPVELLFVHLHKKSQTYLHFYVNPPAHISDHPLSFGPSLLINQVIKEHRLKLPNRGNMLFPAQIRPHNRQEVSVNQSSSACYHLASAYLPSNPATMSSMITLAS